MSTGVYVRPSIEERLYSRGVRTTSGCLEYSGARNNHNYGAISLNYKMLHAHRVAWELANGPVPDGLNVLHRCDNPPCFELTHLFLGTHQDNMIDMATKGRASKLNTLKTHCPRGHEYAGANLYEHPVTGKRSCRACIRAYVPQRRKAATR